MADHWRQGRKVGRTLYRVVPPGTGDGGEDGVLIGVMDTSELAARVVEAVNGRSERLDEMQATNQRLANQAGVIKRQAAELEALRAEVWRFWEHQPHTDVMWSELDNPYHEEYPLIAALLRNQGT